MRNLDFIIAPKTKSKQKDYARIADKMRVPYDTLIHVLQKEGEGIEVVDPEWLEECIHMGRIEDFGDHIHELPLKTEE